ALTDTDALYLDAGPENVLRLFGRDELLTLAAVRTGGEKLAPGRATRRVHAEAGAAFREDAFINRQPDRFGIGNKGTEFQLTQRDAGQGGTQLRGNRVEIGHQELPDRDAV